MSSSSSSPSPSSAYRLAQLQLTDEDASAYLLSRLDPVGADMKEILRLDLFVGGDVFSGVYDVAASALEPVAETFGLSPEDVKKMTLEALRMSDNSQFLYDFRRNGEDEAILIWRLESEGFGVSQQIGRASLKLLSKRDAADSVNAAFSYATAAIDGAGVAKTRFANEAARLEQDRRRAIEKYEKAISETKRREEELIGKLALVLNEKKAEIRRLKRTLEESGRLVNNEEGGRGEGERAGGGEAIHESIEEKRKAVGGGIVPRNVSDTKIYGEDTDVDSDASSGASNDDDSRANGNSIPAKKLRKGASSVPNSKADKESRANETKVTKSHSFVNNFLRDSSDEDD